MGYGWGGYANGRIPYSALIFVRGAWLEPKAAYWAEAMSIVFFSIFGKHLVYSEGFRDIQRQEYLYDGWIRRLAGFFVASYPGGSIHGWALAIDVDLTDMTAEEIDWLHTVGRLFGWNWETTGKPNNERWHLDFNLEPSFPFDPANYQKAVDDTMSAADVSALQTWLDSKLEPLFDDEGRVKDAARREGRLWRLFRDTSKADDAPDAYVAIAYSLAPTDPRQVIYLNERQATSLGSNYLMTADTPPNAQRLSAESISTAVQLARGTDRVYAGK